MKPRSVPPVAVLAALLVVSILPRLATLQRVRLPSGETIYHHVENDERVFQTLVDQVGKRFFNYTLQGTPMLDQVNRSDYDHPLFFHPPAFVYTALLLSPLPLPLVPVLLNLGTIAFVFFIGRRLYDDDRALWAAFLTAVCPVTWFVSQKIWIDNMLIFTAVASVAAVIWAADRDRAWAYAAAGIVFGFAILSKVSGAVIFPALAVLAYQRDRAGLTPAKIAAFTLPAAVLGGWWELTLRTFNGQWLPSAFPGVETFTKFPFVGDIVARPWYFYLQNLIAVTPVYVLALDGLRRRDARDLGPALWFVAFLLAMMLFGLRGGGYQTRYLAPAYPALALLAAAPIARFRTVGMLVVVALVGYGMGNALLYAVLGSAGAADFQISVAGLLIEHVREIPPLQ